MNRLKQPSTYAGIGLFVMLARGFIPPQWQMVIDGLIGAAASASVILNEKS